MARDHDRSRPLACVIGDMDLLRPLGRAGIPCAAIGARHAPVWYSRYAGTRLEWGDAWETGELLVAALVRFGRMQAAPPVLFYQHDSDLLLIARHRDRLRRWFRFVLAEPALVEDLVDKARFQALCERLGLPVPRARRLDASAHPLPSRLDLRLPLLVKPITRHLKSWRLIARSKAVRVDTASELARVWSLAAAAGIALLAQELIPGSEAAIESYHVYVDEAGTLVSSFTGRKLRTYPREFGDSTALATTDAGDVRELGEHIVTRLQLRGVAKLDFKRDPTGRLHLLEVNPRFTLWHHLGACAGLNIPAQVYSDLTGGTRSPATTARAGVHWCRVWPDVLAARAERIPLARWIIWSLGCQAKSLLAWDDPLPIAGALLQRLRRVTAARPQDDSPHAAHRNTRLPRHH